MEEIKNIKELRELKGKNGLKTLRKRKLKEARRKLSDIAEIIESIVVEEEKQTELKSEQDLANLNIQKELLHIENLYASVKAIQASILLIDSVLE
ncbi:MAG: hypothetical protein J6V36_02510 [Clostridia bacterium]|nr:hypothetical protein [Clostridia bacterium]